MKAEITVDAINRASILLDGVDVANHAAGFRLDANVRHPPTLTLDLHVNRGATFEGDVIVGLGPDVEDLLLHLGWTPPGPDSAPSPGAA